MDDRDRIETPDDAPREPQRRRWESPVEMWLSDDPPWDPEVLENVEELSGRLEELRSHFGTL